MHFSRLAALLCLLWKEFGSSSSPTSFQEDCCRAGRLTAGSPEPELMPQLLTG